MQGTGDHRVILPSEFMGESGPYIFSGIYRSSVCVLLWCVASKSFHIRRELCVLFIGGAEWEGEEDAEEVQSQSERIRMKNKKNRTENARKSKQT